MQWKRITRQKKAVIVTTLDAQVGIIAHVIG